MANDPRDALWEATFRAYYDVYYSELVATTLVRRWQYVDDVTKVLVAATTSVSAVSGWALWKEEGFHTLWSVIAGICALLAIISAALAVPHRLKDWTDLMGRYRELRIDLETLRERMSINTDFDVKAIEKSLMACRDKIAEIKRREPLDLLLTNNLENKIQDELNVRLADQIKPAASK